MNDQNIAIIGIACRFPGAKNYREFWTNLENGVNSIKEIPPERWDIKKYYSPIIDEPNKSNSKWCGLLDDIDQFDNRFFSISPREAKNMDPQQRLLLEETWHCIEDAGVPLSTLQAKKTSVYVGVMATDYHQKAVSTDVLPDSYATLGNYICILSNRISYTFGLTGASISIDAACAASMVALHNAKTSLLTGESDYAIAAGVSLNLHPWKYISFGKSRMLSPDGQCKTFDKDANGYVPGEGVDVLLLQPLEKALRAHNHIYGIIKGSAISHGGQTPSITAPRVKAQHDVISSAYKDADISPETVTYVEAHGTGTSLGDPIEIEALTWAFREHTDAYHFCHIGSVKTNIGHLEAAAGIAGIIKVLLMMRHKKIPPTLNIKTINPVINFEHSPFIVATELYDWHPHSEEIHQLRASVSSFGFGGVNSHALIESYSPNNDLPMSDDSDHLFILSAKSPKVLKNALDSWKDFADSFEYSEYRLSDICATLMTGREHFPYRYGTYIKNKDELKTFLQKDTPSNAKPTTHEWCLRVGEITSDSILPADDPLFKKHLDTIKQHLSTLNIPKKSWTAQPLHTFMASYAYTQTLIELGFTPSIITGEKSGLWLSLTISGMITLADTLAILAEQKTLKQIKIARPQIPFYDPVTQHTHLPYHFDEDYLNDLVDNLNMEMVDLHYYIERARLLKDSQFTFKKYLEEWAFILHKATGFDLDSMLYNDRFIHSNEYRKEQILLILTIISNSLHQLDKKWDLTRQKRITDQKFQELLDLIIDGVMPKETAIELFINQKPNLAAIAAQLNQRQAFLDANKSYEFIKKHSQTIDVVDDVTEWFNKAMANAPTYPNVANLIFGQSSLLPDNSIQVSFDNLKKTLLQLWLEGVDIKWELMFPEGSFNKVPLPTYCFDLSSFWLKENSPEFIRRQKTKQVLEQLGEGSMPFDTMMETLNSDNPEIPANKDIVVPDNNSVQKEQNKGNLPINFNSENPVTATNPTQNVELQSYLRVLSPFDSIIRDHIITGKPMLPGAGMIQFGLEALQQTLNQPVNTLQNIVFKNPGIIETDTDIKVEIYPKEKKFVLKTEAQELCQGEYVV